MPQIVKTQKKRGGVKKGAKVGTIRRGIPTRKLMRNTDIHMHLTGEKCVDAACQKCWGGQDALLRNPATDYSMAESQYVDVNLK